MTRVVLDTNVIVSALLQPLGAPARVFMLAAHGAVQLCASGDTYAEYEQVIRRPRLKRAENEIQGMLRFVREKALWVRPAENIRACLDPDDDIFLECAQAAHAQYLVTGNAKDFPPKWAITRIVTPRQFLDTLAQIPDEPA